MSSYSNIPVVKMLQNYQLFWANCGAHHLFKDYHQVRKFSYSNLNAWDAIKRPDLFAPLYDNKFLFLYNYIDFVKIFWEHADFPIFKLAICMGTIMAFFMYKGPCISCFHTESINVTACFRQRRWQHDMKITMCRIETLKLTHF